MDSVSENLMAAVWQAESSMRVILREVKVALDNEEPISLVEIELGVAEMDVLLLKIKAQIGYTDAKTAKKTA
jgi:hypothetical protein